MALTTVPVELANLDGAVTVNESSADVDFRIESNGNANMLFVNGGNDQVGIGADPSALFHVTHGGGGFDEVARLTSVADSAGDGAFLGFHGNSTSKFYGFIGGYDIATNKGGVKIGVGNGETAIADSMTKLTIDNDGHVTMPSQPAFSAYTNAANTNIPTDASEITVAFGGEYYDQNSDYNTSTYTFTAPVTGKYQLMTNIYVNDADMDAQYIRIRIATSNRNYDQLYDPRVFDTDPTRYNFQSAVLADMDASETALIKISQYEGAAQMDVPSSTVNNFSGYLVA